MLLNKKQNFNDKLLLFVIGAQTAGTTWLWHYFNNHQQVFVPALKELHYFDCKYCPEIFEEKDLNYTFKNSKIKSLISPSYRKIKDTLKYRTLSLKDESFYIGYFKKYVSNEVCFADITPNYCALKSDIYLKMSQLHPKTKFIFIMRNPVDRFCSAVKHKYKIENINEELISKSINDMDFKIRSNYNDIISNLEQAIDKEKILYLFYEDLFCDKTIQQVCDFVDIKFIAGNYNIRHNVTRDFNFSKKSLKEIFVSQKQTYEFIFEKFDKQVPNKWRQTYNMWRNY